MNIQIFSFVLKPVQIT